MIPCLRRETENASSSTMGICAAFAPVEWNHGESAWSVQHTLTTERVYGNWGVCCASFFTAQRVWTSGLPFQKVVSHFRANLHPCFVHVLDAVFSNARIRPPANSVSFLCLDVWVALTCIHFRAGSSKLPRLLLVSRWQQSLH